MGSLESLGSSVFNPTRLIDRLACFPDLLGVLVGGLNVEDARARSPQGAWSIVKIVSHLNDEEQSDFPVRLRGLLADAERAWAPIDPEGWAESRRYLQRDLREQLDEFACRRREHIDWIRSVADSADWETVKRHPLGDLRGGDMLAAWCDHDILHARQILKRTHELIQRDAGGYSTRYAGEWQD